MCVNIFYITKTKIHKYCCWHMIPKFVVCIKIQQNTNLKTMTSQVFQIYRWLKFYEAVTPYSKSLTCLNFLRPLWPILRPANRPLWTKEDLTNLLVFLNRYKVKQLCRTFHFVLILAVQKSARANPSAVSADFAKNSNLLGGIKNNY